MNYKPIPSPFMREVSLMALVVWLREPELHLSPFELIHYVFLVACNEMKTEHYVLIYWGIKDFFCAL